MNAPVDALTLTVPPPVDVAGALYDNVRPPESLNDTDPLTAPVSFAGLPEVAEPATGVLASTATATATVKVCTVLLTPLEAVTVKVSVVDPVAD